MRETAQTLVITLAAILASVLLFSGFMYFYSGVSPVELFKLMYKGSCGSTFSIANTLEKAAPLILTALCTALPARVGLINIGAEGALILGGLAAVSTGLLYPTILPEGPPVLAQVLMALAGMAAGGLLIAFVGFLRHWRGVNETISSLLMFYIAFNVFTFLVEGPMKDPESVNKPSTYEISESYWLGKMIGPDKEPEPDSPPGTDAAPESPASAIEPTEPKHGFMHDVVEVFQQVHWGLGIGIIFCVLSYMLMYHTTFGFSARMVGGNVRAAQAAGLPVGWVIFITCSLAGAAAGLAGMVEIATGEHRANASLNADYGFTGILVAFMARHHPLGIIPVAVLFGGLVLPAASSSGPSWFPRLRFRCSWASCS